MTNTQRPEIRKRFGARREKQILGNCADCDRPLFSIYDDGRCPSCHYAVLHVQGAIDDPPFGPNADGEALNQTMNERAFERALMSR